MGCEESVTCFQSNKQLTGRAKIGTLRRVPNIQRSKSKKNINLLEEGSYELTQSDWDMVEAILLNHQLLFKARGYANQEIMNRLENFQASPGKVIFRKGDPSDYFYIIIKGSVQISDFTQDHQTKQITRGAYFGDVGIYSKAVRSATAKALSKTCLVGLKKENFLRISLELSKRAQAEVFSYIKNIPIFKHLNLHQKHKIAYLAQELKFKKGDVFFKRGEVSNCLYVVKTGKVVLTIPERDPIEVKSKQSFGESCLNELQNQRFADAVCSQVSTVFVFSRNDIVKYMGREVFQVQMINKFIWAIKHDKNLKVSPLIMESMLQLKEIRVYKDREIIAEKGQPIQHFVISLEGGINNQPELEVFNTDYLLDIKFYTERLVKNKTGRVALISIEAIEKRYNRSFNSLVDLNQTIWKQIESVNKIQQYVSSLTFNDFWVIDTKGIADYGCTLKVQSQSNINFALKVVEKADALDHQMQTPILKLLTVGAKLTHPLISKQYRILNDKYRLYFMSRWVEGQDLYDLVERQKKVHPNIVKHLAACIINIMEYLHCRRIVWRELKIQSFVIDYQGYLTLVDLMHLEELEPDQSYLQNPSKATFMYLAPEVLSAQGYGMETDFWALGIIIYRMLVGQFPFGRDFNPHNDNALEQLAQEIYKPLHLPSWLTSDAKILLKLLLNPHPFERNLITFHKLKNLTFFKDYDWLGLIEKKNKSIPYFPKKSAVKCPQPIQLTSWLQQQQSRVPSPSSLDNCEQTDSMKTVTK